MTTVRITAEPIPHTLERGYLYYIDKDGYLVKTPTTANRTGKRERIGPRILSSRVDGAMVYMKKDGHIYGAPMREAWVNEERVLRALRADAARLARLQRKGGAN